MQCSHAFADGYCFPPIASDLFTYVNLAESGELQANGALPATDAFRVLEQRLAATLRFRLDPNRHSLRGSLWGASFKGYSCSLSLEGGTLKVLKVPQLKEQYSTKRALTIGASAFSFFPLDNPEGVPFLAQFNIAWEPIANPSFSPRKSKAVASNYQVPLNYLLLAIVTAAQARASHAQAVEMTLLGPNNPWYLPRICTNNHTVAQYPCTSDE